jgi:alkylation response protein AidB-like acyl-CoA dehydrogenase
VPTPDLSPDLAAPLARASQALQAIVDATDEEALAAPAARALVETGLHLLALPAADGGLGATLADAVDVLAAIGAIDGSSALGLAMHTQVVGGALHAGTWPEPALEALRAAVRAGGLVNAASTEEGSGSPARGGLPATTARRDGDVFVLDGEKTWTTWLPALTQATVSARLAQDPGDASEATIIHLLVDLSSPGIERLPGFDALGMRGSASGRLRLGGVRVPAARLVARRSAGPPSGSEAGTVAQTWFALCIAAVYLGIGEGARRRVVRWAIDRRPGDGSSAVADLPTIQLRLGRLDAALRAARVVLLDVARRDLPDPATVALAKLVATNAAVTATDEALRIAGGPGFLSGPLERAFRDARAGLINPPLEDVALGGFGRALVQAERDRSGVA